MSRPAIPITLPVLGEEEAAAARRVILSGWVTQGPEVAAFEAEFAALVGAPHACAVANCTAALHLALLTVGVGPGDEVITVSHSFIATANAIRQCGATPVFVDIDPLTFNLDPERLAAALTPKTRAILAVHQMGMPCDLERIAVFARAHDLRLIEDAACAIGSEWRGSGTEFQPIGRPVGDIACFSFHPRKVLSTGDGGMLTTANPEFDARFRLLRQHGMNLSDLARHAATDITFESYPIPGFNYRMTDIQAAVGRVQLTRLPELLTRRRAIAEIYRAGLAGIDGVLAPAEPAWGKSNWQSYCVRLPPRSNQRQVMRALLAEGIATRRGIMCAHREAAYADIPARFDLRHSEQAQDECILLPLYPQMQDEPGRVLEALRNACA